MFNLFHVFSSIELKFYLVLNYTIIWYLIYTILGPFAKSKVFQLKMTTAIFYVIVPTTLTAFLIQDLWIQNTVVRFIEMHFLLIVIAFYLFSTIAELKLKSTYNWSIIIHHIVFGTILFIGAILAEDSPSYWLWIIAVQFSGIFVSIRKLLVLYPNWYTTINPFLEKCDFFTFLSVRIIFQTILMFFLAAEMSYNSGIDYLILAAFVLSFGLNLYWFRLILKRGKGGSKKVISQVIEFNS